jgi:UDP-N-acetylglucosamine--N-acetylmuramyl-(pentapeptide) pyrophosphoryl-undecaprenol N-acetylglucosamine transferase
LYSSRSGLKPLLCLRVLGIIKIIHLCNVWIMRLMLCCAELGLGHVSRITPLAKRLEKNGHELFFFSGGRAYQLLRKEFRNVYPCTPVAWYENAHGIVTSASLINILFPLPTYNPEKAAFEVKSSSAMETIHRYYDLRRPIKKIKPDLLVSDGDMHALRLASRWHIPSVYVANMIRPSYGFSALLNPGERFVERYVKQCLRIIVPDNPPPYTVSEYNLGDLDGMGIGEKVEFVGSFFDTAPVEGREEHIYAAISGPLGTRAKLTQMIVPVLEELGTKSVVSLGVPGERRTGQAGNCEKCTWLSAAERKECIRNAKLVIFSGGHATCFETIKYGKPSICVPTQPEQMGNAAKLQNLQCSITAKNQNELRLAIQKIEANTAFYKRNVAAVNAFSNRFRGLDRAVEIIETALK